MPIEIIYTIFDIRGKRATTSVKIGSAETEERTNLFAVAWADALDNIIHGVIRSATALIGVDISGLTGNVALTVSDVEEIGSVQLRTNLGMLTEFNIPAIDENMTVNETGELDESETNVQALIAAIEDGITVGGATIGIADVGGSTADTIVYMRERSRNSGARGRR